jgi:hypothetical protein
MPRPQAPLNSAKAPSWASNTISWVARIGAHEKHTAMAKPHMSYLHDCCHPPQQADFVAPVELVGFPRREAQRDVGRMGDVPPIEKSW